MTRRPSNGIAKRPNRGMPWRNTTLAPCFKPEKVWLGILLLPDHGIARPPEQGQAEVIQMLQKLEISNRRWIPTN